MIGAINYLREVSRICKNNKVNGISCKDCYLGKGDLKDTLCPRLTDPSSWSDEKTTKMAKM